MHTLNYNAWAEALGRATSGKYDQKACRGSLIIFAFQLDDLWPNGRFQPQLIDRYTARLRATTPETAKAWEKALQKIDGPDAMLRLYAIGFVIQMDRLFESESFNEQQSELLLGRLGSLPRSAVEECKKATQTYATQAAVMLVQTDALFDQTKFQKGALNEAIRSIKESLPQSDENVAEISAEAIESCGLKCRESPLLLPHAARL